MIEATQIQTMRLGGRKLARIRQTLVEAAAVGMSLKELNQVAEKAIVATGGQPSFSLVPGYHWATCLNLNQGIVHGIPNQTKLKTNDLLSIDVGLLYRGYHTDCATTIVIGQPTAEQIKFLQAGRQALKQAIKAARLGNRVGHISAAMQQVIEAAGYHSARNLTGHGVGSQLHLPPQIPCFLADKLDRTPELTVNQTLAIEVIYTMGNPELITLPDKWTMATKDNQPAAIFEETVLITPTGPEILSTLGHADRTLQKP